MTSTDTELRTLATWVPQWEALGPIEDEISATWTRLKELRVKATEIRAKLSETCPVRLDELEIRFWSKVRIVDDEVSCWHWTGASRKVNGEDYGLFKWTNPLTGKSEAAGSHRVSLFLQLGSFPTVTRHTCDNPICVRPAHLTDGTHAENMQDRKERGRYGKPREQTGESNGIAVLTDQVVIEARRLAKNGLTHAAIAERLGFKRETLNFAIVGKTWSHLDAVEAPASMRPGGTRLNENDIRVIRKERAEGVSLDVLAERYGVTKANIYAIVSRKSWKHVV